MNNNKMDIWSQTCDVTVNFKDCVVLKWLLFARHLSDNHSLQDLFGG